MQLETGRVRAGTFALEAANSELWQMRREVKEQARQIAAMSADARARARRRAAHRAPDDLQPDIREVFALAEQIAGTARMGTRASDNGRSPRRRTPRTRRAATASGDGDSPPPPASAADGVLVRIAGHVERPGRKGDAQQDVLTDGDRAFLDYIAEAAVRTYLDQDNASTGGT